MGMAVIPVTSGFMIGSRRLKAHWTISARRLSENEKLVNMLNGEKQVE